MLERQAISVCEEIARQVPAYCNAMREGRIDRVNASSVFDRICDVMSHRSSNISVCIHQHLIHRNKHSIQVPVTVSNVSMIIVIPVEGMVSTPNIQIIGPGAFVSGRSEDEDFGKWDHLVAVDSDGSVVAIFRGHGGETYPGRLVDHIDALRRRVSDRQVWPVQVDLDPSNVCTNRCTWCFSADYRSMASRAIAPELLTVLIRELAEGGTKILRFGGGGEPLTHPKIGQLVQFAHNYEMTTALLTSGDLLTEEYARVCVDTDTYVRVSLNAASDRMRLKIHRPLDETHDLTSVLKNLRRLAAFRDQKRATCGRHSGRHIGATFLIDSNNYLEIYDAARIAKDTGIDHISFRRLLGTGHAVQFDEHQTNDIQHQAHRVLEDLADEDFLVFFPWRDLGDTGLKPSEHFTECLSCTHRTVIEVGDDPYRANIQLCGRHRGSCSWRAWAPKNSLVLGEYDGKTPFQDIWLNERMRCCIDQVPGACTDCIDRGANLILGRITNVLRQWPEARFLKFSRRTASDPQC